ncbi:flagellar M-ring protein FliF [bacterium]|jgi:flagellar M-ring protein FliF|nr:flagellar M-ring protein FliF [bacterium]MBT4292830.1 flagellar M-ring protein FliF [bacterium]MBT7310807.1 flagellar M-ring protein FliF [bacterium]
MKQILDNLNTITGKFTFNQKVLLGGISVAVIISLVIFSTWMQSEDSSVLFTNLDPADASVALEELSKQNINAELTNGGTTILVPENQVHRLRVDLLAKGIPASGTVGWGLFDGNQYGMTEFVQNVNYKRAMEGELVQTISAINGVKSARVHLVLPKNSIFKKMQSDATASIVVNVGRGQLSEHQVNGIQRLVSGSVEGLELTNVSIIDQHGVELTSSYSNDGIMRSDSQLALKKEIDEYLSLKAASMLDRVLGPERSLVRVDATLNFEQMQQERKYFDPDKTVVLSEVLDSEEREEGAGSKEVITTNYELSQTVETTVGEIGGISSLSVAVFVDGTYAEDEEGNMAYVPLSDDELTQINNIVESSIGYNSERGDRVEVVNMQFQFQDTPEVAEVGMLPEGWMQTLPELIGRILLFALAAFMILKLKKNLGQMALEDNRPKPRKQKTIIDLDEDDDMPSIRERASGHVSTERMVEEVKGFANDNPNEVADLVSAWIKDEEEVATV